MKRFVLCVSLFVTLVILPAAPLFLWAYRSQVRLFEQAFIVPDCRVAGVGDSRMETSIDPALWPGFCNFGQSASPFGVSLLKARAICKSNPELEVLLIEMWPKTGFFTTETGEYDSTQNTLLAELMNGRWSALFRAGALQRFKLGVLTAAIANARSATPTSWLKGGFFALHKEATKNKWRNESAFMRKEHPQKPAASLPEKGEGERELRNFLREMHGQNVRVVLLTAPVHPWFRKHSFGGSDREARFEARMKAISAEFGVPWLNYWADPQLTDVELLADSTHLNWRGAAIYTQRVRAEVEALQRQWRPAH
ncbi:MAG: hypothetical protein ACI4RT_06555 [Candidatus Spyradenecus sp.]